MGYFKKKAVTIRAIQFYGGQDNQDELDEFITCEKRFIVKDDPNPRIEITTLEGIMTASLGDWIIKGIKGEFYPCKPDIFRDSYEEANPPIKLTNQIIEKDI